MINKITRIFGIGFAVFWMIFTFLEYWQYHEEARRALAYFQYSDLILVLLSFGAILVFIYHRFANSKWVLPFSNGLGLVIISTLIGLFCMNGFFYKNLNVFLSISENFTFLGTILGTAFAVYFIILLAYSLGRVIYLSLATKGKVGNSPLVFIAIGIFSIVALLFVLGIFGILYGFILWPLLLFLLFLSWRSAWRFIQLSLWNPVTGLAKMNPLGLSLLYLLLIFITMNFIQVARPLPTGFDAMTHYVNISSLIRDYHGLVQGHGAYNWSLFMSLGLLLFNKISVTLALSFVGGILSLFALYRLSRNWLDANLSILVLLLFYSLPMISWLSYRDMKVDMGLLFYSLLIINLMVVWLKRPEKSKVKKKKKIKISAEIQKIRKFVQRFIPDVLQQYPHLVLIGILAGFSFGIKFSALTLLLALIPAIAYAHGNKLTFAAASSLVLAFTLIGRLDAQAGLRPLHLWVVPLQWALLITGLGLSLYIFLKQKEQFLKILRMSLVCIVLSGLVLSPWLIKNLVETRSLSISSLVSGRSANPQPGIEQIKQIYQTQQNGN